MGCWNEFEAGSRKQGSSITVTQLNVDRDESHTTAEEHKDNICAIQHSYMDLHNEQRNDGIVLIRQDSSSRLEHERRSEQQVQQLVPTVTNARVSDTTADANKESHDYCTIGDSEVQYETIPKESRVLCDSL